MREKRRRHGTKPEQTAGTDLKFGENKLCRQYCAGTSLQLFLKTATNDNVTAADAAEAAAPVDARQTRNMRARAVSLASDDPARFCAKRRSRLFAGKMQMPSSPTSLKR